MRFAWVLAAALSVHSVDVRASESEAPLVLKPSSEWNVNYADDSCRLARTFGEGDAKSIFYIERYGPSEDFFMLVAGKPFEGRDAAATRLHFGPGGKDVERVLATGDFGEFRPAIMTTSMFLHHDPKIRTASAEGGR